MRPFPRLVNELNPGVKSASYFFPAPKRISTMITTSGEPDHTDRLHGVYSAALTPFNADLTIDHSRLTAHCHWLLEQGCDGVCLFGTTGEGTDCSGAAREQALGMLLESGFAAERIVLGTATSALDEAVQTARAALTQGVDDLLVLPPFFFKELNDAGLFRFYAELIERVGDRRMNIYLYHIPGLSGVSFSFDLLEQLQRSFPDVVVGIKDSSADWSYTSELLRRLPQLTVVVGAEHHLPRALANGGSGTICGMANVIPQMMRRLYDSANQDSSMDLLRRIEALQQLVLSYPFIAALKFLLAELIDDRDWYRVMPPLAELEASEREALLAAYRRIVKNV
jgi:4-hydroxy-tetrahydrodipicolinate synthase